MKEIGNKLRLIGNKPLIYWSIKSVRESKLLDDFYISTDSPKIRKESLKFKCKVIDRPKKLSQDGTKTIEVLKHAIKITNADVIVCVQPTSPIRPKGLIDNAIRKYNKFKVDTLATGRILHEYPWGKYNNLPRQKLSGWFWDDGLLYIMKSKDLLNGKWVGKKKYRLLISKKYNLLEIDSHEDFSIIKNFFKYTQI